MRSIKKNISFYILFFCLVFIFSGCGKNSQNAEGNDWENEVLWADKCGQDGLACCVDEDPACKFGQTCCVSPANPSETYCADECRFGELDEFCRETEPACNDGLICAEYGRCAPCGGAEQACCGAEVKCSEGLTCHNEICEQCGLPGNVCCGSGLACLDQDKEDETRTECQINRVCSFCGSKGRVACQNEPYCNDYHLLNNQTCYQCGELNQPCCQGDAESKKCNTEAGLHCELGFCSK